MKKITLIVMALVLLFNVVAIADEAMPSQPEYGIVPPTIQAPEERLVPGELNISLNGKVLYFAYKTYAEKGTSFAHGEKLMKELGYDVTYDKSVGVLTASKDGNTIQFVAEKDNARLEKNTLYIPVRATAESLGYTVNWNGEKYLVEIVGDQND